MKSSVAVARNLKSILSDEFPETTFSVRQTRNNGYIGQLIEVNWDGLVDFDINHTAQIFEIANHGYTVQLNGSYTAPASSRFTITQ